LTDCPVSQVPPLLTIIEEQGAWVTEKVGLMGDLFHFDINGTPPEKYQFVPSLT